MSDFSVRFLTRRGCLLCAEVRGLLEDEVSRRKFRIVEVDIDDHPTLRDEFTSRVPVILGPDDQVLGEGRLDRKSLRRALRRL